MQNGTSDCGIDEASADHILGVGQPRHLLCHLGRLQENVPGHFGLEALRADSPRRRQAEVRRGKYLDGGRVSKCH